MRVIRLFSLENSFLISSISCLFMLLHHRAVGISHIDLIFYPLLHRLLGDDFKVANTDVGSISAVKSIQISIHNSLPTAGTDIVIDLGPISFFCQLNRYIFEGDIRNVFPIVVICIDKDTVFTIAVRFVPNTSFMFWNFIFRIVPAFTPSFRSTEVMAIASPSPHQW